MVLWTATVVVPDTLPWMVSRSDDELPGPPRKESTVRVELPEALKLRSVPPGVLEMMN